MNVCAIVLAAGLSRRMGTQKLLLPYAGSTVIGHVVDRLLASAVDRILVVVGRDAVAIAEALAGRDVTLVANPDIGSEMLDSVRCGLRALPAQCDAVLVALGDQPSITSELVEAVCAMAKSSGKAIVVPTFEGRRGHPLLFGVRYRDEVLSGHDAEGLRGLLRAHREDVAEVETGTAAILSDIDWPEDYRRAVAELGDGCAPP